MLITILEAQLAPDQIGALERGFQEGSEALPPEIVESFLVRDSGESTRYRVITVWQSRAALENYRASVEKPKGVEMFEAAGASPQLVRLQVLLHAAHPASSA